MNLYKCKFIDKFHIIEEQFVFANSILDVKNLINNKTIISIKKHSIKFKNPTSDFTLPFFKILSQLINNKYDLISSLNIIINCFQDKQRFIIKQIINKIEIGYTFSKALEQFDKFFDNIIIKIIEISEQSSNLSSSLLTIVSYIENKQQIKQRIIKAIRYPCIMLIIVIFIINIWIFWIIPQFAEIFNDINIKVPLLTNLLLKFRFLIISNKFATIIIFIAITTYMKFNLKKIINKINIISNINNQLIKLQFCESLSIMLKERLNILVSLDCLCKMEEYFNYSDIAQFIRQGHNLAKAFEISKQFSNYELAIISTGEKTGEVYTAFQTLSEIIKFNLNEKFLKISTILPTILVMLTGLLLIMLAYSTIIPLYSSIDLSFNI